jgi:magnesium-protoporphyrin O-methyltransferase
MRDCCVPPGCEIFGERTARRDARRYRRKGLDANACRLVDFLTAGGLGEATVLEVGGGVGAIEIELLQAGAARVVNVEMSPAYEQFARELLEERGLEDRVERRVLDFAREAEQLNAADIVVLHKVVCCYPDMEGLVRPAADRTRRYLALTYPQDRWYMRAGVRVVNLVMALLGRRFRSFIHPPAAIVAAAAEQGLRPVFRHDGRLWQQVALERAA